MIAFVADVHLWNFEQWGGAVEAGINRRGQATLDVFEEALETAEDQGCTDLVVLGDMFDGVKPPPQLVTALMRIVDNIGVQVHFLKGNHDQVSDEAHDHALGPLSFGAHVVDKPKTLIVGNCELWLVPFQSGYARTWFPNVVRTVHPPGVRKGGNRRVLCTHLGIEDEGTPPWLKGAHDSITLPHLSELMSKHDFSHVFAGNWHEGRAWKVKGQGEVHQVGALVPTGFNNPGEDYGFMCILREDGKVERHQLAGPRFIKTDDARTVLSETADPGNTYYVHAEVPPEELVTHREALAMRVEGGCQIVNYKVTPNGKTATKNAREAAQAARTSTSVQDAVTAYVKKMTLPTGVQRPNVQGHMKRFLGL